MSYNEEVLEDVVASVEDSLPVDQSLVLHICSSLNRFGACLASTPRLPVFSINMNKESNLVGVKRKEESDTVKCELHVFLDIS